MAGTKVRPHVYALRLSAAEKRHLDILADAARVTLADAFREGAYLWLLDRLADQGVRAPEEVGV